MADPVIVACPKDVWTLVAQNVTAGIIWLKDVTPNYLQTYVMTGNPAPTDLTKAIDFRGDVMEISASAAVDVYLYSLRQDGEVRADL